jgi:hypothetical protein
MAEHNEVEAPVKKGGRLKTLILLGAMVVGEAVLIVGALMVFSGPPEVQGGSLEDHQASEDDKIVEQLVADAFLPNSKRGLAYLYDTEIYVQVKKRHQTVVSEEIERFRHEIMSELTTIWRTADPSHFDEPRLETLTRKVYALMNERFGVDEQSGEPIIVKAVIVMGTGLRMET